MEVLIAFCFGLVFGSFFNVVIYRLPRGLSLIKPGSHCPNCGRRLSADELIPVFSFLLQKGRCKTCRGKIHWRYPLVEFISSLGFALFVRTNAGWTEVFASLVFFSLLIILAFIDLEHKILPNVLTLPGIGLGLMFALMGWTIPLTASVIGAVLGLTLMAGIALVSGGGLGIGDAKLMAMIGAFLGWIPVLYVLFWASVLGSITGVLYLYVTKQGRKTPIPFGPSIAAAALAYVLFL